jgi:glycosyltransferase involved in cell wall biosynthesis
VQAEFEKPFVVHVITGLENAGAEGALYRLVTRDTAVRHHVISCMGLGKYGPMLDAEGITVECLNITPSSAPLAFFKLIARLRRLRPDAVQCWMYEADVFGGLAARLALVPRVNWSLRFSTVDLDTVPAWMRRAIKASPMLSSWVPSKIVCCGYKVADEHTRMGWDRRKMVVVHNGIDTEKLQFDAEKRKAKRAELGVPEGRPLVGMVARNDPQKDYAGLIEALGICAKTHDFEVLLTGNGVNSDPSLQRRADELGFGDRLHLSGPVMDVGATYSALDLHVLVSRYGEGFPNVVAEAMACGAMSASTDSGDADRIVGNSELICPMNDHEALADMIGRTLSNREHWPTRQVLAKRVEEEFNISKMIAGFHEAWGVRK